MGDFNGWSKQSHPLARVGSSGIWEGFLPGIAQGAVYKYHVVSKLRGYRADKADPFAVRQEVPPRTGSVVWDLDYAWDDAEWMEGRAAKNSLDGADVDLRGPRRLLAPQERGEGRLPDVSGARAGARRLRGADGVHARRAPAGDGASLLRLLGIPDHRVLRSDLPLRHAAGPDVPGGHPAPPRHRRDPRLGAFALSLRRARPRLLRRHLSLRARGPAAGLPPRLEDADLQLRPRRGAQLPPLVGALLARALPRRRPARRRRGLDAAPGLLAQGRRVGRQPLRRPGEPRCDGLPAPLERGGLRALSGRADDGRGVDDLAHGVAPDVRRRPRVRNEVGPRLDARHARLPRRGPDLPQVRPQQAHVPDGVRRQRELSAAAVARRGRARQVLAGGQDAGRRLAEARQREAPARRPVRAARQEAALHGRRVRPVARVGPRPRARLESARASAAPRRAAVRRGPEPALPRRAGPLRARRGRAGRLRVGRLPRRRRERALVSAQGKDGPRSGARRLQLHARPAAGLPRRRAARRHVARSF